MWAYVVPAFDLRGLGQLRSQTSRRTTMNLSRLLWKLVPTPQCGVNAEGGSRRAACARGAQRLLSGHEVPVS